MKKMISTLLLLALLVGVLCACNTPKNTSGDALPSSPVDGSPSVSATESASQEKQSTPEEDAGIKAPVISEEGIKAVLLPAPLRWAITTIAPIP